uniref:PXMP2/4 family protein 4 n=1 Tax=Cacopsylla melanoneura TaxID=428564 RepID=A0A8D8V5Y4_9HEMI
MKSFLGNVFNKFIYTIKTKPLQRGMAMYSITYPSACFIQQYLNSQQEHIDYKRVAKFALFGPLVIAPGVRLWYKFVDKMFTSHSFHHILGKLALEQVIYAPIFYTVFYSGLTLMDGGSLSDATEEVKSKAFNTYCVGLTVWPFLQLFNYSHVSDKNRMPFMAFFGLMWTVYLSYTKYVLKGSSEIKALETKMSQKKVSKEPFERITLIPIMFMRLLKMRRRRLFWKIIEQNIKKKS